MQGDDREERGDAGTPASMEGALAAAFGPDGATPGGGVVEALSREGVPPSRVLLREAPEEAPAPVVALHGSSGRTDAVGRYQVLGEIARGGIGVVLRGRDVDLGRDVAMKVLRDEHAGDPRLVQRFVEEAQIGGQLQHPGIVPVYELGLRGDRRPYFTMKLVKGRTLAALFAERRDASQDRRRFLAIFEQVCQTMAYAHARGVVHRDLKPSNVMVGAFGEVQVVDWGLAKVLAQGGVADERRQKREEGPQTIVATVRTGTAGSQSMAGSVMGTPAYMPPEQARGAVEDLDERADVFALGAILCEVLTGRPPYTGDDALQRAAAADLADARARLAACGADAEIVALAERCLAPSHAERPRDAGVVASAVAAHLAAAEERVRKSEIAAVEARAQAAEDRERAERQQAAAATARADADRQRERAEQARRARRLTMGLAASVMVCFAVVASAVAWWTIDRAQREEAVGREIETAIAQASYLRGRAAERADVAAGKEALAAAQRAIDVAAARGASEALRRRAAGALVEVQADEARAREAEAKRKAASRLVSQGRNEAAIQALREAVTLVPGFADAHFQLAELLYWPTYDLPGAEAAFRRTLELDPEDVVRRMRFVSFLQSARRDARESVRQLEVVTQADPDNLAARAWLIRGLVHEGRLDDAAVEARSLDDLLGTQSTLAPRMTASRSWDPAMRCKRWVEYVEVHRSAVEAASRFLRGEPLPTEWSARHPELAYACDSAGQYATVARLVEADGFRVVPSAPVPPSGAVLRPLPNNLWPAVVRAGLGEGADARTVSDTDRARFRAFALMKLRDWYTRPELVRSLAEDGDPNIGPSMPAGFAREELLGKLPPEEHDAWRSLWSDVDAAIERNKAGEPSPPPAPR